MRSMGRKTQNRAAARQRSGRGKGRGKQRRDVAAPVRDKAGRKGRHGKMPTARDATAISAADNRSAAESCKMPTARDATAISAADDRSAAEGPGSVAASSVQASQSLAADWDSEVEVQFFSYNEQLAPTQWEEAPVPSSGDDAQAGEPLTREQRARRSFYRRVVSCTVAALGLFAIGSIVAHVAFGV